MKGVEGKWAQPDKNMLKKKVAKGAAQPLK